MKIEKILILILQCMVLSSCESDKSIFDLSTPHLAIQSYFEALKHKETDQVLDCLSAESLKVYGSTYEERSTFLSAALKKSNLSKNASIKIIKVENLSENSVKVFYNQVSGRKIVISNLSALLVKEGNNWKIVVNQ